MKYVGKLNFIIFFVSSIFISAQTNYIQPPKEVVDIVTAPRTPGGSVSPAGNYLLLSEVEAMPSIAYMSQPLLRIGGMRITANNNSRQRTSFFKKFTIKNLNSLKSVDVNLPKHGNYGSARWSFDDKYIILPQYFSDGIGLWMITASTGESKMLLKGGLNLTLGNGYMWLPGSDKILVYTIPENRGNVPQQSKIPTGPTVQETSGKVSKVRTYQDLLKNVYDEELFDYYTTSQLVVIDIKTGEKTKLNSPAIYTSFSPSPDGKYFLIEKLNHPYSYLVPFYRFPTTVEVWDSRGKLVHTIAELPLAESIPLHGVAEGPRNVDWNPIEPAELIWVEALDGGDPHRNADFRDNVLSLSAPFNSSPKGLVKIKHRFRGISWVDDNSTGLVYDYNWKKRWITISKFDSKNLAQGLTTLFDLSIQDRYANPGSPVMQNDGSGNYKTIYNNGNIYLTGRGASPQGDRPFLDEFNISSLKRNRIFHCQEKTYESFVDFAKGGMNEAVIRSESKTEVPNYFLLDLTTGEKKQLTFFKDPAPQLTGMKKELIKYKRDDGVQLSGTLYLPPNYKKGERLPLVMWAYPREYSNARIAGQIKGSPYRFTFFRGYSQLFFVTQGYAVLDAAQMPVVGDPETMNDTFIKQIVASAKAAIDTLDEMGIIDPKRVGVGGHSYGAFMTGNLLAHCDLFAAGIARSGAYNRTLTPFGFQSERRTLWEAPEIYFKLSPFMHADKVNEPILLIHGEADNNSGTFPIQSKRFYHALKGHGAIAKFVLLPNESHGYRAKESVLHVLAEMFDWFDKHVKNKK